MASGSPFRHGRAGTLACVSLLRSRRTRGAAVLAIVVLASAALVIDRYFVHPRVDAPGRADAIIVLAGSPSDRLPAALDLLRQRVAPTLALSTPEGSSNDRTSALCPGGGVVCFVPTPDNTRGEAAAIGRLVAEHGWQRIVVVTSRDHISRARLLITRCTDVDVAMVASDDHRVRAGRIMHELGGYLTAHTVLRGC